MEISYLFDLYTSIFIENKLFFQDFKQTNSGAVKAGGPRCGCGATIQNFKHIIQEYNQRDVKAKI